MTGFPDIKTPVACSAIRPLARAGAAAAASLAVALCGHAMIPRDHDASSVRASIELPGTPCTAVDFVAAPAVTTPRASVAAFSPEPLTAVAFDVDVHRVHRVAIDRIGGLYGP